MCIYWSQTHPTPHQEQLFLLKLYNWICVLKPWHCTNNGVRGSGLSTHIICAMSGDSHERNWCFVILFVATNSFSSSFCMDHPIIICRTELKTFGKCQEIKEGIRIWVVKLYGKNIVSVCRRAKRSFVHVFSSRNPLNCDGYYRSGPLLVIV